MTDARVLRTSARKRRGISAPPPPAPPEPPPWLHRSLVRGRLSAPPHPPRRPPSRRQQRPDALTKQSRRSAARSIRSRRCYLRTDGRARPPPVSEAARRALCGGTVGEPPGLGRRPKPAPSSTMESRGPSPPAAPHRLPSGIAWVAGRRPACFVPPRQHCLREAREPSGPYAAREVRSAPTAGGPRGAAAATAPACRMG
eukprot:scaffold27677_cov101-Isochrysis_galbana.AAC.1